MATGLQETSISRTTIRWTEEGLEMCGTRARSAGLSRNEWMVRALERACIAEGPEHTETSEHPQRKGIEPSEAGQYAPALFGPIKEADHACDALAEAVPMMVAIARQMALETVGPQRDRLVEEAGGWAARLNMPVSRDGPSIDTEADAVLAALDPPTRDSVAIILGFYTSFLNDLDRASLGEAKGQASLWARLLGLDERLHTPDAFDTTPIRERART